MKTRRTLVLKGMLSNVSADLREELQLFLGLPEQRALAELPVVPMEAPLQESDLLQRVHWSWFLPTLKSYSSQEQQCFLASFETTTAGNLARELEIPHSPPPFSESGKNFLKEVLFHSLVGPQNRLLPLYCLKSSPLHRLLDLSKKELIAVIDDLSMYDLAAELRQIVETKILKTIYSFLSEKHKKFLKQIMGRKESYVVNRLNLEKWDQTKASFSRLLHKRGLSRLGAALSGQHPDFIWYLCHGLDIGRGSSLFKLCMKEKVPGLTDSVMKQIEEVLAL